MPSPTSSPTPGSSDRRQSPRSETTHLVAVRVNPHMDGPVCGGKLQDISAGGIGVLCERAISAGDTFLIKPFREADRVSVSLLYRAVRCEPRGGRFLVGGILVSAAGAIERDTAGRIVPAELERIRRTLMAA